GRRSGLIQINQLQQFSRRRLHKCDFVEILIGRGLSRQRADQEDECCKEFLHKICHFHKNASSQLSRSLPDFRQLELILVLLRVARRGNFFSNSLCSRCSRVLVLYLLLTLLSP